MALDQFTALIAIAPILVLFSFLNAKFKETVIAPIAGLRWSWEPRFLLRLRYTYGARQAFDDGYNKFKDSRFKVLRTDEDILVISNKYVDELRNLSEETLSPLQAHVNALLGHHTGVDTLLGSNLHTRMLQQKLTPKLREFLPAIRSELLFAMRAEIPPCKDAWVSINATRILLRLVARISARLFVAPLCRNEAWLNVSINYTIDVFRTVLVMRLFPSLLQPIIGPMIPAWWQVRRDLALAQELIVPLIEQRNRDQLAGQDSFEKANDLLQWMMDGADETEKSPAKLASKQLLLTLASIHTTTMSVTHALYDLASMPEYIGPLRDEIEQVLQEEGGWQHGALGKMRKLDSFLKESQRRAPPSRVGFNRIVMKPLTLSDGLHLPEGTHITMAAGALALDDTLIENPHQFDGLRYYHLRQAPGESGRHQFAMTDENNLHFGHGKYACPGRFLASNEIKTLLGHILMEYDFKLAEGQSRPANKSVNEYIFPDPDGELLFRERANLESKSAELVD